MYTTNLLASDINVAMSYTSCCNILNVCVETYRLTLVSP